MFLFLHSKYPIHINNLLIINFRKGRSELYINGKVFGKNETIYDEMERAYEAVSTVKNSNGYSEYSLRDKYFPYIESFLPKTERLLFQYISKYEDRNSFLLNTPYPLDVIVFNINGDDSDIIYKCTRINKDELIKDIAKVPKSKSAIENASLTPLQLVLLMIIRYYLVTKQKDKAKTIYYYYGYSIYWSIYNSFLKSKGYAPNKETMVYTVNELTYKNILKKIGSVKEWIGYNVQIPIENDSSYERLADFRDEDIRRTMEAIIVNMRSKIREVSSKYYANWENKETLLTSKQTIDVGEDEVQTEDTSITAEAEVLAQAFTNDFFVTDINTATANRAAMLAKDVSAKELKVALDKLRTDVPVNEIYSLYAALLYLYLTSGESGVSTSSIKSLKFFMVMKDMFKKGNSINVNIIKIRDLINKWLEDGSNVYRITNREATKTGYRRAMYYYFILSISQK